MKKVSNVSEKTYGVKMKPLKITISLDKDGRIDWKLNRDDVPQQQFLDILRVVEDQTIMDRTIEEMKRQMQGELSSSEYYLLRCAYSEEDNSMIELCRGKVMTLSGSGKRVLLIHFI